MQFKLIAFLVLIVFSVTPCVSSQQIDEYEISQMQAAAEEARRDARADVNALTWFFAGISCNVFTVLYAHVVTPRVPVEQLAGKSPAYVNAYALAYREEAQQIRRTTSLIGCGIAGAAVGCLAYLVSQF